MSKARDLLADFVIAVKKQDKASAPVKESGCPFTAHEASTIRQLVQAANNHVKSPVGIRYAVEQGQRTDNADSLVIRESFIGKLGPTVFRIIKIQDEGSAAPQYLMVEKGADSRYVPDHKADFMGVFNAIPARLAAHRLTVEERAPLAAKAVQPAPAPAVAS